MLFSLVFKTIKLGGIGAGFVYYELRKPADPFTFAFNLVNGESNNKKKEWKYTPLITAARRNDLTTVEHFLKTEDPNKIDEFGNTALHYAIIKNDFGDMAKRLLENGANPNILNNAKCYPIDYCREDHEEGYHHIEHVQAAIDTIVLKYKLGVIRKKLGLS